MKFKINQPVSVGDLDTMTISLEKLDIVDLESSQELLDDIIILTNNITKYGITEPVMDLIGGTLESWNITIHDKEVCLEGLGAKAKEIGKKILDGILEFIRKCGEFIRRLFSKQRTDKVQSESKTVVKEAVKLIAEESSIKVEVDKAPDNTALAAGSVTQPEKKDTITIQEHMKEVNELKAEISKLQNAAKTAETKANKELSGAKSQAEKDIANANAARDKARDDAAKANAKSANLSAQNAQLHGKVSGLHAEAAIYSSDNKKLKAALSSLKKVNGANEATLADVKKSKGYAQYAINEHRRIVSLKVSFCGSVLNVAKELNSSFEKLTLNSGWSKSLDSLKSMLQNEVTGMIPAGAIGPAATEISQLITIMTNVTFLNGDSFVEWRENATKSCKYLKLDGVKVVINPEVKKVSTMGKLGYVKDYVSGELGKKYEGTAAVVNKVTNVLDTLTTEANTLKDVQTSVDNINI